MRVEAAKVVILFGVGAPYDAAIGRLCLDAGLRVIRTGKNPSAAVQESPLLCVVRVDRDDPDGLALVQSLLKQVSCPLVVLGQGLGSDLTMQLSRSGAADVIEVPGPSQDIAARTMQWRRTDGAARALDQIIGESSAMRRLRADLEAIASVRTAVLLQGETGTGKGLVARTIHHASPWAEHPWVHVDCSALSPTLIESELFGHERGAFTGAGEQRAGRFETAGKGTVFLDEIGDLELRLQTKLLRVLQDREFERVGGTRTLRMSARVIAATSRDLREEVRAGRFRGDLYFRLKVNPIEIPSLRHRRSDIPLLVRAALPVLARRLSRPAPRIADDFYARLQEHPWPGNVRELMNVLERCLVQTGVDTLEALDLEDMIDEEPDASELRSGHRPQRREPSLREVKIGSDEERVLLERAIVESGGNIARAARRLQVPRGTLRYRIRAAGLRHLIPKD